MTAPRSFFLVAIEPGKGERRPLEPGLTLGREGCDLVLDDDQVSRRHAAIRAAGEGLAIEDLGSRNGSYVNDQPIEGPRPLADGDTVRLGRTVWRFQASAAGETSFGEPAPAQSLPPPSFAAAPRRRARGSAARRGGAVLASYAAVLVTAVAVIAYFVAR